MHMLLQLPAIRSNGSGAVVATVSSLPRFHPTFKNSSSNKSLPSPSYHSHHYPLCLPKFPILSSSSFLGFSVSLPAFKNRKITTVVSSYPFSSPEPDSEGAKLAQVSKRLENTSRHFKRLGSLGFWSQLVCTVVAAGILSFSAVVNGKITSPFTFYATAGGIAAAFVSVFWSFGYIRLSDQLRRTANEPAKAPPRVQVVNSLKNGTVLNILGMGATILGMQATVGLLVAKALTSSVVPFYQGTSPVYGPVLALDVFLVQASANTILSHFLGLVSSLELLRSVTLPPSEGVVVPRAV